MIILSLVKQFAMNCGASVGEETWTLLGKLCRVGQMSMRSETLFVFRIVLDDDLSLGWER